MGCSSGKPAANDKAGRADAFAQGLAGGEQKKAFGARGKRWSLSEMLTGDDLTDKRSHYDDVVIASHDEISSIFKALDKDKNGSLSASDMHDLIRAYDEEKQDDDAHIDKVFKSINASGSGEVDEKEFRWYIGGWACKLSTEPMDIDASQEALATVLKDMQEIVKVYYRV
jgi:hypothetical protein